MDNNRVKVIPTYVWFLLIALVITCGSSLYYQHKVDEMEANTLVKSPEQIKAENKADSFERLVDSLSFRLSAKEQTIIINKPIIYEAEKRDIVNASTEYTDSLFRANLKQDYIKYSRLLDIRR